MAESKLEALIARLEKVTEKLEVSGGSKAQPSVAVSSSSSAKKSGAYDFSMVHACYDNFLKAAKDTANADIETISKTAIDIFQFHENVVQAAALYKKPKADVLTKIQSHIQEKLTFLEKTFVYPRKQEFQAKSVKEGSGTAFWITVETPVVAIKGVIESAEYSGLKVKQQKIDSQTKWMDSFFTLLKEILSFVTVNFPTGLIWSGKEESDFAFLFGASSSAPTTTTPAEPKKEEVKVQQDAPKAVVGGGMGALFAQLNKGEAITQGLKHVDKKKKDDAEASKPVEVPKPVETKVTAPKVDKGALQLPTQPAKKHKVDFTWFLENFVNDKTILLDEETASLKDIVRIENCHNCAITINAKVKGISVNRCKKLFLTFQNVVSNVEVIHSKSVEVYAQGSVPSIQVDSSESIKVTLSKDLSTEIVSSKVTELNVTKLNAEGEYEKDFPVTEQFVTKFDKEKGAFVTKPMDLFL
jgi:adenylyl cyclase-associated protein